MRVFRVSHRALVFALVSVAFLTGCSRQNPVAPLTSDDSYVLSRALEAGPLGQGAFFPLAVGNRWHAVSDDHIVTIPTDGGPPTDEMNVHTDITREMTGTETISGLAYTLLRETLVSTSPANPGGSTYTTWIRYRQDADGLYESDVTGPPASGVTVADAPTRPSVALPVSLRARVTVAQAAAYERSWDGLQRKIAAVRHAVADPLRVADAASGEIIRLDYPLHPGASWTVRESPHFTSTVERVERLDLPAGRFNAYRIRIGSEFFGPEDTVHLWMSRSGQLRLSYRLVSAVTDENGNVIGEFSATHEEIVDAVSLVGR
jgi:hypothetical protein